MRSPLFLPSGLRRDFSAPMQTPSSGAFRGGGETVLRDLLKEPSVQVMQRCPDWKEAVTIAGELLHRTGAVEARYVSAMVRAIDEYGPYMVVAPGVALVHARPEDGVREVCMGLLICREGVLFGHGEKDPIHLIFAFGAVDDRQHLRALSQLMTVLNDASCIESLRSSSSASEALRILRTCLETP
jgi:mannitol/fructose-specific phosphotransferase system IIA component (Ntr-type)